MTKGINRSLLLFTAVVFISSCGGNVVFTDSSAMPGRTWKLEDKPAFSIIVQDTLNSNNLNFIIRTGSSYPFRNIFLFVTTVSPEGKSITDTLSYDLADEKGNWYGKGFGDIHELQLPYKSNVFFPISGTYQITVHHGMRVADLTGVYDFGLRVEKTIK